MATQSLYTYETERCDLKLRPLSDGSRIDESYSIFQQPWWLDAVAPGRWKEVSIRDENGIVARMPYVLKKKLGVTISTMPKLTQSLGPWIRPLTGKYATQLSIQKDVFEELIKQLPRTTYFFQSFAPEITNWLPFYWKGFRQTTSYSYRLEDLSDLKKVWEGLQNNIRGYVRKAQKQVKVKTNLSVDRFIELLTLTFQRQGKSLPYDPNLVIRLDRACRENNAGKIFYAEDERGQVHSAIYLVWDRRVAYYLMSGSDPALRNSGANSLLLWEAIQFASTVSKQFDFEGSMVEDIERYFRAFGARQIPYFQISKESNSIALTNCLRRAFRKS